MSARTIAIGDIHGCDAAFAALIDAIEPDREDTLIPLGDYIDRGPDSRGVLERVIALSKRCKLIPLLGNHEEMLLDAIANSAAFERWLTCGGTNTLQSYGWTPGGPAKNLADWFPGRHLEFLKSCIGYYETDSSIFVHAGYLPNLPMDQQPALVLRWRVASASTSVPHQSGKIAIVGHTAQSNGQILDLGFLKCIDTNCVRNGWLTALDTTTGQVWQTDRAGIKRNQFSGPLR